MRKAAVILGATLLAACGQADVAKEEATSVDLPEAPEPGGDPPPPRSPTAALGPFPPKDECAGLPGFAEFRDRLLAAVDKRDAGVVAALADPAIRLDFGGGAGRDELRDRLVARPELWGELAKVIQLGCAFEHGNATMPWIFARHPQDVDVFTTDLVLAAGVPLRARAENHAPIVRQLGWELVTRLGPFSAARPEYVEVEAVSDKARGYVAADRLHNLVGYRVLATRDGGAWRLTAFVAGD